MTVDMTFCASPNCKNECGRKMQPHQNDFFDQCPSKPIYYSYFCGEPIHVKKDNLPASRTRL